MDNPNFLCTDCTRYIKDGKSDKYWVTCPRCGEYGISGRLARTKREKNEYRKCSLMVRRYFEFTGDKFYLNTANFDNKSREYDKYSLNEKISNFLNYLADNTTPGKSFTYNDTMLFITPSLEQEEFNFIWQLLVDDKLVVIEHGRDFKLTYKGWQKVYQDEGIVIQNQGFMAMSFTDSEVKSDYENIIADILEDLDLKPIVLFDVEHNEDAVMEILYHIKDRLS